MTNRDCGWLRWPNASLWLSEKAIREPKTTYDELQLAITWKAKRLLTSINHQALRIRIRPNRHRDLKELNPFFFEGLFFLFGAYSPNITRFRSSIMNFQGFFGEITTDIVKIFFDKIDGLFTDFYQGGFFSRKFWCLGDGEDFMAKVDGTLSTSVSLQSGQLIRPFFCWAR